MTRGDHAPLADRATRRSRMDERWIATVLLVCGFWAFWWIALTFYWWLAGAGDTLTDALRRAPVMMLGAALCLAIVAVLRLLGRRSFIFRALLATMLLVPASIVYASVSIAVFQGPEVLLGLHGDGVARSLVLKVIRWTPSLVCCAAMVLALDYAFDVKAREARIAELASAASLAQLAALRLQVNPHFLFNALNSGISLIVTKRPIEAEALLRNLATFLRSTLAHAPLDKISLQEELALQGAYLQVETARFADRLHVVIDVTAEAASASVPSLLLQPLLENAVKHGVSRSLGLTTITVRAAVEAGRLALTITNEIGAASVAADGLGLGLANVRARIAALYPDAGGMEAGPLPSGDYRVCVTLPFERHHAPPQAPADDDLQRAAHAPG